MKKLLGMTKLAISRGLGATCVLVVLGVSAATQAEPMLKMAAMTGMDHGTAHDDHAHHRQMMQRKGYVRSAQDYAVPDLELLDMDGSATSLAQLLDTDKPVLLTFIYTTCTTICPVLSATFSQVQQNLGDEANQVRMISITIDPDQDTPQQMRKYAERWHAGPQWQFITGTRDHIVAVQKVFDVYRGAKTNHEPITLLRASGATSWVRIEGIASAADIVREYDALTSSIAE
jgi:protein SCO1/2